MSAPLDREACLAGVVPEGAGEEVDRYADWGPREADLMLLSLNRRRRTIFLLYRKGGHSYAEIAAHFGITPMQVERHMAKALIGLRRAARLIDRHRSPDTGALPLFVRLRLRLGLV